MRESQYYSGNTGLYGTVQPMRNSDFLAKFPDVKGKRYDSFSMMVMHSAEDKGKLLSEHSPILPVTRIVYYKTNGSKHKCGARCRNAKGPNCECSCNGESHGADG